MADTPTTQVNAMSELTFTENTSPRKRGRPKGSKNKPKTAAPAPVSEAFPTPK